MAYDYREAVKADVKAWLADNFEYLEDAVDDTTDRDEVREFLNDTLWTEDSVTGNASGSYTFNRAEAKKYVKANIELAVEALTEFGYDMKHFGEKLQAEEWEYLDVTIRCYLLGEAIEAVIDEAEALRGE